VASLTEVTAEHAYLALIDSSENPKDHLIHRYAVLHVPFTNTAGLCRH
jgi:hypothetical protein